MSTTESQSRISLANARKRARHAVGHAVHVLKTPKPSPPPQETLEAEFERDYARCAPFTMTSKERMYALWQAARHVSRTGVQGDVVECGVWRGGSTMLAALALRDLGDDRRLWLYDTFEGMPEPGPNDGIGAGGQDAYEIWRASQADDHNEWCYAPLSDVRQGLQGAGLDLDRFTFVQGKVEETIPGTVPEKIALLRMDTDWYASSRHELENLYPRLVSGGVLIVDDYGHWDGARKAVDEYFAANDVRILFNRIDLTGRLGIKP